MQIVKKALSELHKTEKNIRRHSERQIKEYVRSLEMFGQIRPLVVTDDGEILVGNGMYDALISMGAEDCDVYIVSGLTATQKKKLMLADNKVYEMGFTDVSVLDDILSGLDGDFDIPGYDEDLLKTIVASPAEVAAKIESYGKAEPTVSHEPVKDSPVYQSEAAGTPAYEPPVRTQDGGFVAPAPADDDRPFVICPKCGEKIWL